MSEEIQEKTKKPFFTKGFFISLAVSFVVGCGLFGIVFSVEYFTEDTEITTSVLYRLLADGFGVTGLLMAMGYVLSWISSKGTFDILFYSIINSFRAVFSYKKWKEDPQRDYYSYKQKKDAEERKPLLAILLVSVIFICTGLLLLIGFYANI